MGATITSTSAGRAPTADEPRPTPTLVLALHADRPTAPPSRHVLDGLDEVRFGRGDARVVRDGRRLTLHVPDPRMSAEHGRLVRQGDAWLLDDPGSKNGAVHNGTPTRRALLGDGDLLELGHTGFLYRLLAVAPGPLDATAAQLDAPAPELTTFDGALAAAYARFAQVATTDVAILITGETGTGKELVARARHTLAGRRGPFVAVNCGALPETLVEAELFGARKGAFSGATVDRLGLVRGADGGTLFLDEIGELRPASQAALLRVLQEREVLPLGETRAVRVDVRVCAATHRRLDEMVRAGGFRDDLHARLRGFTLTLPPLRARREDLGLLIGALLARRPGGERARFTPAAMRRLFAHAWPHNVRELDQALTAALALAADRPIDVDDLGDALRAEPPRAAPDDAPPERSRDDQLRARLTALLGEHGGNIAAVARVMGKDRMQIHRWVRRFAIDLDALRR